MSGSLRSHLLPWFFALLALQALAQDTLLQYGYNYIAHESGGGMKRLLPGYMGGGITLHRNFTFPAFDREACVVMDKDAQPFYYGIFSDASQAGSTFPIPFPPETYVDFIDAVMPNAHEQLLVGMYSPTLGAPMVPFVERTVQVLGITTATTVKLPPESMEIQAIKTSPTGFHLLHLKKGWQQYVVKLDTALSPVWVKKFSESITSICVNHYGEIFLSKLGSVSKLRADGVVIWEKSYAGWNWYRSLTANMDGGFSLGVREPTPIDSGATAVLRLDSAGNFLWGRHLPPGDRVAKLSHGIGSSSLFVLHGSDQRISKLSGTGNLEWTRRYPAVSLPPQMPVDLIPGPNGGFWAFFTQHPSYVSPYFVPWSGDFESSGFLIKADSMGNTGCAFHSDTLAFSSFTVSPTSLSVAQPTDTMIAMGSTSDFTLHSLAAVPLPASCYDECPDPLPPPVVTYPPCSPPYTITATLPSSSLAGSTCYLNGVAVPGVLGPTLTLTLAPDTNHILVVTPRGGSCVDSTEFIRVAGVLPAKPDLGPDRILCAGSSLTLDAGAGYASYSWGLPGGTLFPGGPTYVVTGPFALVVRVTNSSGCEAFDTINIASPLPPTIIAPAGICPADTAMLSLTAAYPSMSWSTGDSGISTLIYSAGTYTASVIDTNGCSLNASATVNAFTVTPPALPDSVGLCLPGTAVIAVTGTFSSYAWSTGDTTSGITVTSPGLYNVSCTDIHGCVSGDSSLVYLVPSPTSNFSHSGGFPTVDFSSLAAGHDSLLWDFGDGVTSSVMNPSHTYATEGTWHVCLTAFNECDSSTHCEDILLVSTIHPDAQLIQVWPNPFTISFEVSLPSQWLGGKWQLFSWDGKLISTEDITTETFLLSTQHLSAGHYLLRFIKDGMSEAVRVEKVR